MFVFVDYLRLSKVRRREARREAGLLLHEHGDEAEDVIRSKLADPERSTSRPELRLTRYYLRQLIEARAERQSRQERRRRRR